MPPTGALPIATTSMVPSCTPSRCAPSPLASALAMWTSTLIRPLLFSPSCLANCSIASFSGLPPEVTVPAFQTYWGAVWAGATEAAPATTSEQRVNARARRWDIGQVSSESSGRDRAGVIGRRPCVARGLPGGQGGEPLDLRPAPGQAGVAAAAAVSQSPHPGGGAR